MFGVSVAYDRLQKLETQIANTVLHRMQANNGVYIPADVALGRHIIFAVDNVDFAEDTPITESAHFRWGSIYTRGAIQRT